MKSTVLGALASLLMLVGCGDAEQPSSPDQKPVKFEVSHEVSGGKVQFIGSTNLPAGTRIGVTLFKDEKTQDDDGYVYVQEDGSFRSKGLSEQGYRIAGSYYANIVAYKTKAWQSEDILKKLGAYRFDHENKYGLPLAQVSYGFDVQLSQADIDAITVEKGKAQSRLEKLRASGYALYTELLVMRSEPEFQSVGFGACCRYNQWLERAKTLAAEVNSEARKGHQHEHQALVDLSMAIGSLQMAGLDYVGSKGKETPFTLDVMPKVKAVLADGMAMQY